VNNNGSHPSRIGRYSVGECIGHGALGRVYAAVDEAMDRRVAVRLGKSGDPRVHQQARLTGQVAHPNVVSVLDLGEDHGAPFAVMERLDGAPLAASAAGQPLDRRLEIMRDVCDALQEAHDRKVVHGGLKPGHVFIQRDGVVKLLDFGSDAGRTDAFTSPEQARGGAATERSDVFSAAATFHFALTGRVPFGSVAAVADDPPPAISQPDVPELLSRVLLKALDKDPLRRHQSINHMRAEIDQVRQGRQGDRQRVLKAAFDRYRDIESLLAERRALGRRLGLAAIERECDDKLARLAAGFPEFARAGLDLNNAGQIDASRATEALVRLQSWHNDVAAEVSVLRAAGGEPR
jgi:serine/threonine protein kinase